MYAFMLLFGVIHTVFSQNPSTSARPKLGLAFNLLDFADGVAADVRHIRYNFIRADAFFLFVRILTNRIFRLPKLLSFSSRLNNRLQAQRQPAASAISFWVLCLGSLLSVLITAIFAVSLFLSPPAWDCLIRPIAAKSTLLPKPNSMRQASDKLRRPAWLARIQTRAWALESNSLLTTLKGRDKRVQISKRLCPSIRTSLQSTSRNYGILSIRLKASTSL